MAQSIQLQGNIVQSSGIAGDTAAAFALALAALSGTNAVSNRSFSLPINGANTIALPIANTQFVYIKNTHASQTVLVTWTPVGGASVAIQTLRPGDFIMFSASAGTGSGITALTLTSSGAATTVDLILFG